MINNVILQGRLTKEPELRQTQSGVSVASFTVAWSEKYNDVETQCFLPCVAWRNTGEFVSKYFAKGQEIAVQGRLQTRQYEDKDGNRRSVLECVVDKAHFCGPKREKSGVGFQTDEFADLPGAFTTANDDDLPF